MKKKKGAAKTKAKPKTRAKSAARPKRVTMTKTRTKTRVTVQNPKKDTLERSVRRLKSDNRRLREQLARKKNGPRRVPARWFEACIANAGGLKPLRFHPPANWWKVPVRRRMQIVRELERSKSPKKRRAALAIAKAEQRHADRPPGRKKNPGAPPMTDADAAREYERTHWGERGTGRTRAARAANPAFGTATELGELVSVVYETTKGGDRGRTEYEHKFEGRRPRLVYNDGGLIIAGGQYRIAEGGIDG